MNRDKTSVEILDYYDEEVAKMISEKYGFSHMESLRRFLASKTYSMLSDPQMELWDFGPAGLFDMWENEQITHDPRTSLYIRGK